MAGPLLSRALLYAHTVRHLRWEQWVYRPIRRVQARLPVRVSAPADVDPARSARLAHAISAWWTEDAAAIRRAEAVVAGTFCFLNHAETIPVVDWSRRYVGHLWSYNLHYFDYALDLARAYRSTGDARYAERFAGLAESWIRGTTPGRGDGWEPYPVSLRVVNWIYALLLFGDALESRHREAIAASTAQQLAFLERRLEWHILANHLQKNLKALVVGGLYFDGPCARRWLRDGARLLWRELFEQVLADGGHFERSPMYHAIALTDFLEVIALMDAVGIAVPSEARERVERMVGAFGVLSRCDGTLHAFNDTAEGIAPARGWIDGLSRRVVGRGVPEVEGAVALPDTGYYGLVRSADGERLVIDCGEPGPSYQPGHAHCDLLSFELDLGGRRIVVDSGVRGYDGDPLRAYVRSTRAHNTVMIAGREQSEIWGTFRVARRAKVRGASHRMLGDRYRFEGAYTPYHDRGAVHRRVIEMRRGLFRVEDRVEGASGAPVSSFLHLAPDVELRRQGDGYLLRAGDVRARIDVFGTDRHEVACGRDDPAQGWRCPEFGRAEAAPTVEMHIVANDGRSFGYVIRTIHD